MKKDLVTCQTIHDLGISWTRPIDVKLLPLVHYQMSSDIVDEPCAYSVFEFHAPEEYWLSFSEGDNIQYIHFGGI